MKIKDIIYLMSRRYRKDLEEMKQKLAEQSKFTKDSIQTTKKLNRATLNGEDQWWLTKADDDEVEMSCVCQLKKEKNNGSHR